MNESNTKIWILLRHHYLKISKQIVRRQIFTYFKTNSDGLCHGSRTVANRGGSKLWRTVAVPNHGGSKPWRGTARFVVRFAKKPNHGVARRFAVCQDTNRTVAVRCGPCKPPRFVEPWSTLAISLSKFYLFVSDNSIAFTQPTNTSISLFYTLFRPK